MWNYLRMPILMLAMLNSLSFADTSLNEVKGYSENSYTQKNISDLDPVKQDTTLIGASLDIYQANVKVVDDNSEIQVVTADQYAEENQEIQNDEITVKGALEEEVVVEKESKQIITETTKKNTKEETKNEPSLVSRIVNTATNVALYIPKQVMKTAVKVQDYAWKKADDSFHYLDNKRKSFNKSNFEKAEKIENKAKVIVSTGISLTPAGALLNYAGRKLANNSSAKKTGNAQKKLSESELDYMIDHTKVSDLMEMIGKQELLIIENGLEPAYLLETIRDEMSHDKLKELYLLNNQIIIQAGLVAPHEMNDISNLADIDSENDVASDTDYVGEYSLDQVTNEDDSVTCVQENNTVLGLQNEIASLKSSLDSMNENFQTLMQTMTMNNLIMSQNNLMMSQMMLNNNMQNQYYGANPAGEKKSSFDDIVDQHYKNYQFQYEGAYNPYAVNQTPFASNYQPQMNSSLTGDAIQSESFFQTGPLNAGYSPGYNFSFGNVYDQSRTDAWTVGSSTLPRQLI